MRFILLGAGLAFALVLGACGDNGDDADSQPTEPATEAAPTGEPTATAETEATATPEPEDDGGAVPDELAWTAEFGEGLTTLVAAGEETVVVSASDGESGTLVAFDSESGDELWRQELDAGTLVPGIGDGVAAVPDTAGVVHAFDAESGEPLWTYESDSAPAQVLVRDGMVFVADANPEWFGANGIDPEGEASGRIDALNAEDGEDEWMRLGNEPAYVGMTIDTGVIYAVSQTMGGEVRMAAVDATDGEQGWSESLGPGIPALPTLDEVHVFVAAERIVALERATGETSWEFEAPEGTLHGPVPLDDFVATGSNVSTWYLVDRAEGEDATEIQYCDCPWLAVAGDELLFLGAPELAAYDIADLDAETPEPVWSFDIEPGGFTQPVVGEGRMFAGTTDAGLVVAFER